MTRKLTTKHKAFHPTDEIDKLCEEKEKEENSPSLKAV